MARYLGKLYPVNPYSKFEIFQLDVLDKDAYPTICNEDIRVGFQSYYDTFLYAKDKRTSSHERNGVVYYNNSSWYVGEADNMFDFIDQMKEALRKER